MIPGTKVMPWINSWLT